METTNTQLTKRIMRKVYIMAYMRRFLRPLVIKSALLSVFLLAGVSVVSVGNVLKNAWQSGHGDIFTILHYMYQAFTSTELVAQVIFVGIIVLSVWLIIDTVRNFTGQRAAVY
jgi:hypothetical protein